ncbi:MAG: rhodanese-like domain-containing protein [Thermonemataceae bacterium]
MMKKVLALLSFILLLGACQEKKTTQEEEMAETTTDKMVVQNLSPTQMKAYMTQKPGIVLDVRTPEEYSEGHLPNAKLINFYDEDFKEQLNQLDKTKTYYVYCKAGGRSTKATELMASQGFTKVYNMEGGFSKWEENN